jgi:O-antigen/teichoic acid export membrane protein
VGHPPRIAVALAVVFVGLLGRAAIDKILALRAGPESVALWAQLQSIVDLVVGVTMAGVGQGLTVLVAQATAEGVQRQLMRAALASGLAVSAVAALALALGSGPISKWVSAGAVTPELVTVAAAAGCAAVVPGLLTAYWLGRARRDRILWLNTATMLTMAGAAYVAAPDAIAQGVLAAQAVTALVASAGLYAWLRRPGGVGGTGAEVTRLQRYMVAGLSIGILSPVAMLAARSILAGALSWDEAGIVQALWRSSEWITAIAAGMLWMVALPRFSATCGTERFVPELARVVSVTLSVSALLLLLLWLNQAAVLETLYDKRFTIPDRAAALFLFGDWLRIGSWVFLYALFAMQRTVPIAVGELLSIPLFAVLLELNGEGLSLEWAGMLYCASYAAYFLFNAVAVLRGTGRRWVD